MKTLLSVAMLVAFVIGGLSFVSVDVDTSQKVKASKIVKTESAVTQSNEHEIALESFSQIESRRHQETNHESLVSYENTHGYRSTRLVLRS